MGIRNSEEPHYNVIASHGEIEIRSYPALVAAETLISAADYASSGRIGFKRLAGYIFGENRQQLKLPMTAPVMREPASVTIAMTAPVLQQAYNDQWLMTFIMPAEHTLDTLPQPLDSQITLKTIPAKTVAVLRYSGTLNAEQIAAKTQILSDWLQQAQIKPLSAARSAAYDPPWTLPLLRRNEIHRDIDPATLPNQP